MIWAHRDPGAFPPYKGVVGDSLLTTGLEEYSSRKKFGLHVLMSLQVIIDGKDWT